MHRPTSRRPRLDPRALAGRRGRQRAIEAVPPAAFPLAPVLLALLAAWLLFSWPWLSGRVTIPWDAKAHFHPQVQFLAHAIARGEWPFWTPNVFSGHPQIADPQSMMFAPPMLLLALINPDPTLRAVDATVLAMLLLGGVGVVMLARELGWHWAGALLAALGFAFGASMAWRLQHYGQVMSCAWWPLAHLALKRALERGSPAYGLGSGALAAVIVLGRDQVGLLAAYLLAGYALWHVATASAPLAALRRSLLPLAAAALAAISIAGLPILLTALLSGLSNRPAIDLEGAGRGSLHPALFITMLFPHLFGAAGEMARYWGPPSFTWNDTGLYIAQNMGQLYIGAAPVLLLAWGTARGVLWSRETRFFTLALAVVLLYALGWYTPVFALFHALLPGVALYRRPADATFLIGGLAALLAGAAASRLMTEVETRAGAAGWRAWIAPAALVTAGLVLAVVLALRFERIDAALPPLALGLAALAAGAAAIAAAVWNRPIRPLAAGLVLAAVTAGDLAWNNGPNGASALPARELDMLEPATRSEMLRFLKARVAETRSETRRDRVELAGLGFHWPNASLSHDLEHTLGYNPVRLGLYVRATGAGDTVGLPDQRTFSPLFPSYRSRLADLLGLRWIATGVPVGEIDTRLAAGDLVAVARFPDGHLYENPRALPRVLFAREARHADFEALLAAGEWPDFDPARTVLLESPPGLTTDRGPGAARILRYRNTEVEIEAESPDGGYVVLNDVWHPWWRAEVAGTPAEILRANVLFRAVAVPPGRQRVRMVFRPVSGAIAELRARLRRQ
jgi:hypothetical protein